MQRDVYKIDDFIKILIDKFNCSVCVNENNINIRNNKSKSIVYINRSRIVVDSKEMWNPNEFWYNNYDIEFKIDCFIDENIDYKMIFSNIYISKDNLERLLNDMKKVIFENEVM